MASEESRVIPLRKARAIWMAAQGLTERSPFGSGPEAAQAAIEQLGYVQIDTINVIERCHHHILFSRIPAYARADLTQLQSGHKSIFEYWTHALSYVPTNTFRFYRGAMHNHREKPSQWHSSVSNADIRAMRARLEREGALSIRDIDDDVPVEKIHPWGSKKPSKLVLQLMFYQGLVTISERSGMVKTYELTDRHFGWESAPKRATEKQVANYLLERALRAQGFVSLNSICYLNAKMKKPVAEEIQARVKRKHLIPVTLEGTNKEQHWIAPDALETHAEADPNLVHILSPFDPLIIMRKRLAAVFGYEHVFEAYVPAAKRKYGYFALPVLVGDEVVALIDLKTDRASRKLLVQNLVWRSDASAETRRLVDQELGRFERFQLAAS